MVCGFTGRMIATLERAILRKQSAPPFICPSQAGGVAMQGYCLERIDGRLSRPLAMRSTPPSLTTAATRKKYLGEVGSLRAPLPWREGRIHLKNGASADQSSAGKKAERNRLQLSGSASRVFPAQWDALQCHRGRISERTNTRISQSTPALSFGRVWRRRHGLPIGVKGDNDAVSGC